VQQRQFVNLKRTLFFLRSRVTYFVIGELILHSSTINNIAYKRTPKRILQWKSIGTRTRGRPRKRWIAGIEEDLQIMGVRRWRKQCEERAEWKKMTEKAKTHSES
jgi:hypothetical protein